MKFKIKLKRQHPSNEMLLGPYKITHIEKEIDIKEADMRFLKTTEAEHWFSIIQIDKNFTENNIVEIPKRKRGRPKKAE